MSVLVNLGDGFILLKLYIQDFNINLWVTIQLDFRVQPSYPFPLPLAALIVPLLCSHHSNVHSVSQ